MRVTSEKREAVAEVCNSVAQATEAMTLAMTSLEKASEENRRLRDRLNNALVLIVALRLENLCHRKNVTIKGRVTKALEKWKAYSGARTRSLVGSRLLRRVVGRWHSRQKNWAFQSWTSFVSKSERNDRIFRRVLERIESAGTRNLRASFFRWRRTQTREDREVLERQIRRERKRHAITLLRFVLLRTRRRHLRETMEVWHDTVRLLHTRDSLSKLDAATKALDRRVQL